MLICPKCHALCGIVCPVCGKARGLRAPESKEPVLLMVLTAMQSLFVEPILQESGVPYSRPGTLTSMLTTQWGAGFECNKYYVPFAAIDRARALIEENFGDNEEIMRALNEYMPEDMNKQGE